MPDCAAPIGDVASHNIATMQVIVLPSLNMTYPPRYFTPGRAAAEGTYASFMSPALYVQHFHAARLRVDTAPTHLHDLAARVRIGESDEVLSGRERDAWQRSGSTEGEECALVERLCGYRRCQEADKHGDRASQAE